MLQELMRIEEHYSIDEKPSQRFNSASFRGFSISILTGALLSRWFCQFLWLCYDFSAFYVL